MFSTLKDINKKCCLKVFNLVLAGVFVATLFTGTAFAIEARECQSGKCYVNSANIVQPDLKQMKKEIQKKGYTFTIGKNPALDYSLSSLCGLKKPTKLEAAPIKEPVAIKAQLPAVWDWREHNGVTPVKNQGSCGSCWAFATVAPFESAIIIKDNVTVDLSEQYLVSCNTEGWGCNGGFWAHDYHVNPGAELESCFPYQASDVACKTCPHPYKLDSWGYVGSSSGIPSVEAIKSAIYQYGPVTAGVAVDSYFQAYTGGVFNRDYTGQVNHGITLVGWDDSKGAWILKNSWGPDWGEAGYMYIKYGVCSVGDTATYVVYKGSTPPPSDDNLALKKPVTASGYYDYYYPEQAVDGDQSTFWAESSDSGSAWIDVDLQALKTVNSMKLKWSLNNYPSTYSISSWDGSQWVKVQDVTGGPDWNEVRLTTPISSQYLRLDLANPNSYYFTLYEWQIFGK